MKTKEVKMCDMSVRIAARVFKMLNPNNVHLKEKDSPRRECIVTDVEPKNLVYPEGWYYAKGSFRNKHTCTSGMYEELDMVKSDGSSWRADAKYCTYVDDDE